MTPIELRPYQRTAIEHLYRYWQQKRGRHPLVVVPTGGGKSFIMAALIREVLARWGGTRIVCATHVRELIAQNHAELCGIWPEAPAGIYSAGLGQRDADAQILFCGIQSVHNRAGAIGHASLLLIDEAHLVPRNGNTAYRRFIAELLRINPRLKVVGFTATPFRLDSGRLDEGEDRIFDGVAYEVQVPPLIRQGFLAPLVTKPTAQTLDVSAVGDRNGDFIAGELQDAISEARITEAAMDEVAAYGQSRRSWLLFGSGVEHAGDIADAVRRRGFSCEAVTGDTSVRDRDRITAAFKAGELRALANANVLTTGFNVPAIDLIAVLRPTLSTALHVQILGRGMRIAPGKENCLVLDFARNVERHGPIDALFVKAPGEGGGESPFKICPKCQNYVLGRARVCSCGHEFPIESVVKLTPVSSDLQPLSGGRLHWIKADAWELCRWIKPGRPPSLRVTYRWGDRIYREWVCFEHAGLPREKAGYWWEDCGGRLPVPVTVAEALARRGELSCPPAIALGREGRYWQVTRRLPHSVPS